MWIILVLVVKFCFKFLFMIFLYCVKSLGDWCKVFFVVVDEVLDFEDVGLNVIELGDKIDIVFVLLLELFDVLYN